MQNLCIDVIILRIPVFLSTASSTGLIYIDPTNLRRSSAISSSAAAAAAALEASNSSSYLTSASSLARAYSIVIRQISDLMSLIPKYNHLVYSQYPAAVKLTYHDAVNLQVINPISFAIWKWTHIACVWKVAHDAVVSVFSVLSCETELCWRKTHSHLELDGVHYGFYRGSVTLRLGLVICWRPWPPQPPAPCLSELCPQGTRQCTGGGQPPHPGRSKVKIKPGIL